MKNKKRADWGAIIVVGSVGNVGIGTTNPTEKFDNLSVTRV